MRVPNQLKSTLASFTAEAARRAIYFDYEGLPTKPPVLLGWYVDGEYAGSIIDPNFAECSNRFNARAVTLNSHKRSVQALLARAFAEDRHLISWSWHDLKFIWPLVPRRQQADFRDRFVNAIKVARPWHNVHFGPVLRKGNARLKYFADALGVHIPAKYGDKLVANHLRKLGQTLEARIKYRKLSKDEKNSWIVAVKHNKWDLLTTSKVCRLLLTGAVPARGFSPLGSTSCDERG